MSPGWPDYGVALDTADGGTVIVRFAYMVPLNRDGAAVGEPVPARLHLGPRGERRASMRAERDGVRGVGLLAEPGGRLLRTLLLPPEIPCLRGEMITVTPVVPV